MGTVHSGCGKTPATVKVNLDSRGDIAVDQKTDTVYVPDNKSRRGSPAGGSR